MKTEKTIYAPGELACACPVHPGEMLLDELKARNLSQRKFADIIGCSYSVLNEVINGHRDISTELSLKIEAALGTPAYIWCNLQSDYNMQMARNDKSLSVMLEKIRSAAAVL